MSTTSLLSCAGSVQSSSGESFKQSIYYRRVLEVPSTTRNQQYQLDGHASSVILPPSCLFSQRTPPQFLPGKRSVRSPP